MVLVNTYSVNIILDIIYLLVGLGAGISGLLILKRKANGISLASDIYKYYCVLLLMFWSIFFPVSAAISGSEYAIYSPESSASVVIGIIFSMIGIFAGVGGILFLKHKSTPLPIGYKYAGVILLLIWSVVFMVTAGGWVLLGGPIAIVSYTLIMIIISMYLRSILAYRQKRKKQKHFES